MAILNKVSQKEKQGALPEALALRLAQSSERNLRRALLMLEACHVQQPAWTEQQEVRVGHRWEGGWMRQGGEGESLVWFGVGDRPCVKSEHPECLCFCGPPPESPSPTPHTKHPNPNNR
jgi:hypothetical protein